MKQFKAHGKCILAGEYGVLRGGQAVVCSLKDASVTLELPFEKPGIWCQPSSGGAPYPFPDHAKVWTHLERSGALLPRGMLLRMGMPVGYGLGSSAAIAVVFAQAFHAVLGESVFSFAHGIEQLFHGVSSGVDIAGALGRGPLVYQMTPRSERLLHPLWSPHLLVSSSGESGFTQAGIAHMADLRATHKDFAYTIDAEMEQATQGVIGSLENPEGQVHLAQALNQARRCFEQWGLVTEGMKRAVDQLFSWGARAVKPTGSGRGGMLLSFWEKPPSHPLPMPTLTVDIHS